MEESTKLSGQVLVTVKMAKQWLDKNNTNRSLREGRVEKFTSDMKNGLWTACTDPIVFYTDGELASGQHRLWAIIESKKPQWFTIRKNFPRSASLNLDTQASRSLVDNAKISGLDPNLSNTIVAWALATEKGSKYTERSPSNGERLAIIDRHREAVEFASKNLPSVRGLRNSYVGAAIARAWYYEDDRERLIRFCQVLAKGMSDGSIDYAAVTLRNYILVNGAALGQNNLWRDSFMKSQNAISHFMRKKPLNVIKKVSAECYPLKSDRREN